MKYDVYGVGNALVDIVTEVDADFFQRNGVEKGVMTLVDEKRQHELMGFIETGKSKMSCGGSAGNTVIAVSQFGGKSFYSCLVAKDELGKFFLMDMARNGVDTNLTPERCPEGHSGRCLVMTSPDADRTMNTFLGISSMLAPEHLDGSALQQSEYVYLEGYLVASPKGLDSMTEAKRIAEKSNTKVALTLSDPNMVRFFEKQFQEVIGASVDLLFCNEEEAMMVTGTTDLEAAAKKMRQLSKKFAITMGANGALVFDGEFEIKIQPYSTKAVDTNGAGDMFAGAFLYAITHGHNFAGAGRLASLASSRVVSQWGPRLSPEEAKNLLSDLIGS
ncbi:MAG: adenosine kinase [Cyclobacteriaceae bacterium]